MDQLVALLRTYSNEDFKTFLWNFIRNERTPAVSAFLPPNDGVAVEFAAMLSEDEELRTRTQAVLRELFAQLSTHSSDASIDRATMLLGYTRAATALPAALALCDEFDRAKRTAAVLSCLRAIAAQLPTEPMLDMLWRKALRPEYSPACVRALLRLDRTRAAALLAQLPSNVLTPGFYTSAFAALTLDEQLHALRALYDAIPKVRPELLETVERACSATVMREGDTYEVLVMRKRKGHPHEEASMVLPDVPRDVRSVWQKAAERTSELSILAQLELRTDAP